jgi:indole-3-glycerol phosphate synthase
MTDFLEQVVAERRADVDAAKRERSEAAILEDGLLRGRKTVAMYGGTDAFTHALAGKRASRELAVIAEVKRVSPAAGPLRADVDVRRLARRYERAGAAAISVLCEPRHWGGSLTDLDQVRGVVGIPVLCKDVIVDERQVVEAWSAGAHAVLLIAEALDDAALRRLVERAHELGMGTLVEAHETAAFERAVRAGSRVVGVNARDLRSPKEIRPERIRMLHGLAHEQQILVAESGISSADDARALPARVDAVLVGTALMRADDPTALVRGLAAVRRPVRVHA